MCVVTGAGRGIGRGMAEGLARHGATVVLSGRTRATLEETAAAIGERAVVVTADVLKEADVLALRDAVLAQERCVPKPMRPRKVRRARRPRITEPICPRGSVEAARSQ